ncbi:MAG: YIP1 family protein [Gammaproteobacteria bacterium]|nr:YIP1 family protein [Gammaproteobacteria bacterium]
MDFSKLIARVKAILLTPRSEWPVIAAEETTAGALYRGYIIWLAGLAALASFVASSVVGYGVPFLGTFRVGVAAGLTSAITGWVLALVVVWLVALLVDALAPTFGGQKNRIQALKVVAYAYTASWIASIGQIIPGLRWLILLAGLIYGIYLLYLGLPHTMKCPPERAVGYTAVTIVVAIIASWIIGAIVGAVTMRMGGGMPGGMHGGLFGSAQPSGGFDADSPGGKLEQWAKGMEAAGKKAEEASQSNNPAAAAQAVGGVLAAALGSKGNVEALGTERIKAFLPESLGRLTRTEISAEHKGALGMQMSEAEATYVDQAGQSVELKVADLGGAAGLAALASWAGVEEDKQTQTGYEKTYKSGGRMIHEEWDNESRYGEYTVIVGERFSVEASGSAPSIDTLKAAVNAVDLAGLEALRGAGVQAN